MPNVWWTTFNDERCVHTTHTTQTHIVLTIELKQWMRLRKWNIIAANSVCIHARFIDVNMDIYWCLLCVSWILVLVIAFTNTFGHLNLHETEATISKYIDGNWEIYLCIQYHTRVVCHNIDDVFFFFFFLLFAFHSIRINYVVHITYKRDTYHAKPI